MKSFGEEALTFDDVLLIPNYSEILPNQVNLETRLTERIHLKIPLLSAAMDTVTDSRTAILLAQEGGLGVIHKNFSILEQVAEVEKVKKTRRDPTTQKYPHANQDPNGCLIVGAAIGVGDASFERAKALVEAGVNILFVDSAHGHSRGVLEMVARCRKNFGDRVDIVGGNVVTEKATQALIDAGAHAIKVGIGPGSICTTRIIAGIGVPQLFAISHAARAAKKAKIPIIADGGIQYSGDLTKALAAGAESIMIGSLFAGTDEAPGEILLDEGRAYKKYRGMGSLGAMAQTHGSKDRYFQDSTENEKLVPEGVEGRIPYRGSLSRNIHQLLGGLRAGMGYCGAATIQELQEKAEFIRITKNGLAESHPHHLDHIQSTLNYH